MAGVDVGRLAQALEEYSNTLTANRQMVGEAFAELDGRYAALREVYDGTAAREFMEGWARVNEAFDAYLEGLPALLDLLEERTELLRRMDTAE